MDKLTYSEIKSFIQDISNELTSVVSTSINDYTHQPNNDEILYNINKAINDLNELKSKL